MAEGGHGSAAAPRVIGGVWGPYRGHHEEREGSMELRGKKVIALGERDGVPGPAVAECARQAGAEVVLTLTACYV